MVWIKSKCYLPAPAKVEKRGQMYDSVTYPDEYVCVVCLSVSSPPDGKDNCVTTAAIV